MQVTGFLSEALSTENKFIDFWLNETFYQLSRKEYYTDGGICV
jgi:hypothetical protein